MFSVENLYSRALSYLISDPKAVVLKLLAQADIIVDGKRPGDIQVHDDRAYARMLFEHNLGLGESFMDGWVDCSAWDVFIEKLFRSGVIATLQPRWFTVAQKVAGAFSNPGAQQRAYDIGEAHYDVGNDLFAEMLDSRLTYTCAYWHNASTLEKAQEAKLHLVCQKLALKPGMTVLDIGCGWGSFAFFAAEYYGVTVVGITVSREQAEFVRAKACETGLPVEILLQDYRDFTPKTPFDRIVSLGMFEHVHYRNYRTYMEKAHELLVPGGLFLLHTIGGNTSTTGIEPWMGKYIFPGAQLPSIAQIGAAAEGLFVQEHWQNLGPDYDRTLMAWHENFVRAWPKLRERYSEQFYRMWVYYLLTCAGSFRARQNQLWQIVYSKGGVSGGYRNIFPH